MDVTTPHVSEAPKFRQLSTMNGHDRCPYLTSHGRLYLIFCGLSEENREGSHPHVTENSYTAWKLPPPGTYL